MRAVPVAIADFREGGAVRTTVYVDILLVMNYIINLLLILCTTKFSGITPKRRRIVAAALFGSLCSLTIFLPFLGFFQELLMKLVISGAIVRIAMPWFNAPAFLKQWFVFFAVNFFFAGAMLAVWIAFTPNGMVYYNGIVYFNISALSLLLLAVAAYLVLLAAGRLSRSGRMQGSVCRVQVYLGGKMCTVNGLVDTGNGLFEPFSGAPVVVCQLRDLLPVLPPGTAAALEKGVSSHTELSDIGIPIRLVPYQAVGGGGVLPAFAPDKLVVHTQESRWHVDSVYVAVSRQKIGDSRYNAILNPEMVQTKIGIGGAKQ